MTAPSSPPPPGARTIPALEVARYVCDVLLDPARRLPVVAVTTRHLERTSLLDADALARELQGLAEVVRFETGDATWALAEALPARLDVYGGAARIWWPGLTTQSDPLDHRLYFVHTRDDVSRVTERIVTAVRRAAAGAAPEGRSTTHRGPEPAPADRPPANDRAAPGASAPQRTTAPLPAESALVANVLPGRIEVAADTGHGSIVEADLPIEMLAGCVAEGMSLPVRPLRRLLDGTWEFSLAGLLPNAWQRFVAEVTAGEILLGRVQNAVRARSTVFVDMLPGVVGICHIRELDYHHVDDIETFFRPGEIAPFQILVIDPGEMRLELSRKRAYGQDPRPSPSLVPGGKPFLWKDGMPYFESLRRKLQRGEGDDPRLRVLASKNPATFAAAAAAASAAAPPPETQEQLDALTAELHAALQERTSLVDQVRELRQQLAAARKDLRGAADRHDALLRKFAGETDPLSSERAFLLAIRLCHARMFDENDRLAQPLRRMRVGAGFLRTVRDLDGIDVDKIVEVCTQVACGIASSLPAREVHLLRDGTRGAGGRSRDSDQAKAWRCSLQDHTASARRLHWWSVPGPDGGVIEFASVGVHDDYSIPG